MLGKAGRTVLVEEGYHERFCYGIGVCSCLNIKNCLSKCSFDIVGAIDIEEKEYLVDRKWTGLLGQVDWPRSNFEYFIKMFNLTAVIGADRVEESVVICDCRKVENKWEEELDRVEIIYCHHILHVKKQADSLLVLIVLVYLMQITRLWKELMLHNSSYVCVWNARTL
jgi:hypothetical protein